MRTIDADALKAALIPKWNCMSDQQFACKAVWEEIENAPTIEPERKKGKWIFVTVFPKNDYHEFADGYYKCSICGHTHACVYPLNYCEVCGAEMEVE